VSDSYYGQPILNAPVWRADIPAYLFLGGLAGASSVLAAGAQATRRPVLARRAKLGALGAILLSLGALIHDLGRPSRFLNMLRVFKPSSPMSVGTWILTAYAPAAGIAAASDATGLLPTLGAGATGGAALLGPAVASYTAALIADTAVPAAPRARPPAGAC
jgi:Polysulphide reductase, NrfD